METTKSVQSVARAIEILKCFTLEKRELKLADIAMLTGLNKSTAHGIIATLKQHGLIDQNSETLRYRLGLGVLALGETVLDSMNILDIAAPLLERLSNQVGETVMLGILDGHDVVYIYKHETSQSMRIVTAVGARNPAYCTSLGKAMLAYLNPEQLQRHLPKTLTPKTTASIQSKTLLMEQLADIRINGYAYENGEAIEGLSCVGAPIFNNQGLITYAISVAAPTQRFDSLKASQVRVQLQNIASEISTALGYRPKAQRNAYSNHPLRRR